MCVFVFFVWFDSLRPTNNLSVIKGRVFLGWTSSKLGLMLLLKDTTQWRQWGSNPQLLGLKSSTLPLSHCRVKHSTTEPLRSQCVCVCVCVGGGGGGQDVITIRTSIMTPLFATVSRVSSAHGVGQGGGGGRCYRCVLFTLTTRAGICVRYITIKMSH